MLVRMSEREHYPVIHVVRRAEQENLLRGLGARHVLDSSKPDFAERLGELSRELGATIAFDAVAGELTATLLSAMPRLQPGQKLERIPYDGASFKPLPLREVADGHFAAI